MQHVVVIGGGLAGCALAEAFSRRGWQVTVLEARDRLGGAVAGLPLIAQHPALTPDFDLRSRLLVAALQQHARLRAGPAADLAPAFEVCGRLQPMAAARAARCVAHVAAPVAQVWRAASLPMAAYPVMAALHQTGPAGQGSRTVQDELPPDVSGQPAQAGIWFPGCAAVSPARWWQQVRQRPQVTVRLGVKVGRIREHAPREGAPAPFCWQVFDTAGALLARADVVVLACQLDSFALADMQEADHGRLRLSAACAWTARADGGSRDEDPGHPALLAAFGRKSPIGASMEAWGASIAFSTTAVVVAQVFVSLPFLIVTLESALRAREPGLEEMASSLGASPTRVFWQITLPTVLPGLGRGAALALARCLGEFGATLTFAGSMQGVTRTMPLQIYLARESDADLALALGVVLLGVAALVVALTETPWGRLAALIRSTRPGRPARERQASGGWAP